MTSAKELYDAQKKVAEQERKNAETQRRIEEQGARQVKERIEQERAEEHEKYLRVEQQKDEVAKKFLEENVVGQLNGLKQSTGGKVNWDGKREVNLTISSDTKVKNLWGQGDRNNPEYRVTHGVSVEVEFDDKNQGHLRVNRQEVDPSNLPQALAEAALKPDVIEYKQIGGKEKTWHVGVPEQGRAR